MLARTLPSLLPDLRSDAALEVAAIYSLRGTLRERPPTTLRPPFRAPHHSISRAGLVGGGTGMAQPGEISLAHTSVRPDRGNLLLRQQLQVGPAFEAGGYSPPPRPALLGPRSSANA
ncbi:MAG: ATP-binding protein [Candidatus Dormibacteraeota bacterium]|nr:ATP-binding protein [Candidatus Dormibacteraeota bacterium]